MCAFVQAGSQGTEERKGMVGERGGRDGGSKRGRNLEVPELLGEDHQVSLWIN